MEVNCYKPGKIPFDIHGQICDFLYEDYWDLQRHLQYSDHTTFFTFSVNDEIVGTIYCVWKIDGTSLPIEEAFFHDKQKIVLPTSAVEIGGLKLDLPPDDRVKLLPRIYQLLLEETKGHDMYITCAKDIESLYRRKFMFSAIAPVTFNYIDWYVAMCRKTDIVYN